MRVYCSLCGKQCRITRKDFNEGWRVCKQCLGTFFRLEREYRLNEGKIIITVGG